MTYNKFNALMRHSQYFPELSPREVQIFLLAVAGYKVLNMPKIIKECTHQTVTPSSLYGYISRIKDKLEITDITRDGCFLLINRMIIFGMTPPY